MKRNFIPSDIKAVIFAGGKGTRLAPYTTVFPKPMVPLGHRPILEIILHQLAYHGIRNIVMSLGYLGELIQAYFQNGYSRFSHLNISYVREQEPMGTAGSLALVPNLDHTFLAMNGDVLTTLDFSHLIKYHRNRKGILTIGMFRKQVKVDLGIIETNERGILTNYVEKPEKTYNVSMGVHVFEPEVLDYIEPNRYLDFPDLVLRLIRKGERIVGYPFDDYWLDIGRHEDYARAQEEFECIKHRIFPADAEFTEDETAYVESAAL
jgi:NDP-sugar pyrophosphorylase family protein